jgi:2-dehydropantoate 2-reductase
MAEYVSKRIVYSARVITGFVREESHRVRITVHADAIHIGSLFSGTQCEEIRDLCRAISAGGIDCFNTRDIGKDLWAKMLYNCALNPLGAIFSVPYGTLSENEESRDLMNAIIGEIFRVMEKHGFTTHWNTPDDYCRAFYKDLVRLTAAHESSMLQDIRAGRRTEIDAMNGEVVRLAASSDVHTPVNLTVTKMIRFIETRNRIQR